MKIKKVCVLGHFGFGENLLNGQTVKTKIIAAELEKRFGKDEVRSIDTKGGIKTLVCLPFILLSALKNHENIIILPAQNGVRIIAPTLVFLNAFFGRKLHYVVIGGWLTELIKNKSFLRNRLKRFDNIYPETSSMKKELEGYGFNNVEVIPNCKPLEILCEKELVYSEKEPLKLCTFSRVMKEKGIEEAVFAVKTINEKSGRRVFTLDIFGQIDDSQTEWFDQLKTTFPDYVKYAGPVPYDKSVEVIKDYFAVVFPTKFFTEGIPGTIIDAYAAGVPVITSLWKNHKDVFFEGETGFGYEFGNQEEFICLLEDVAQNPEKLNSLKKTCLEKAILFTPEKAITGLFEKLK